MARRTSPSATPHPRPFGILLLLGLLAVAPLGCIPPPATIGYVPLGPRQSTARNTDLGFQLGGGWPMSGYGSGHVEPYFSPRLSLPIDVVAGGYPIGGGASVRLGVRHRFGQVFALGGGVGGGAAYFTTRVTSDSSSDSWDVSGVTGSATADLELSLGRTWQRFGLSLTLRPGLFLLLPGPLPLASIPVDFSMAFFLGPRRNIAITLTLVGALLTEFSFAYPSGGGAVGLYMRL